jgi:hypothetical protein
MKGKTMNRICVLFFAAIIIGGIFFTACLDPYTREERTGSITIELAGSARSTLTDADGLTFSHRITLVGSGAPSPSPWLAPGTLSHTFTGLNLNARYTVVVEARHTSLNPNYGNNVSFPTETIPTFTTTPTYLRARGEGVVTVGGPAVTISMYSAVEIATWEQFFEALNMLGMQPQREIFMLTSNFNIDFDDGATIGNDVELTLIARSGSPIIIGRGEFEDPQNPQNTVPYLNTMINVQGTLNLGTSNTPANLIIDGSLINGSTTSGLASGSIINVGHSGELTMNNGVTLRNNNFSDSNISDNGGGVYVDGLFVMNGGTIENNVADNGGGVFVSDDGIFTIHAGTISGNYARRSGGGVFVSQDGTFTKAGGGIIHGSTQNSAWFGSQPPGGWTNNPAPVNPPTGQGENAAGVWRPWEGVGGTAHVSINGFGHAVFMDAALWENVRIRDTDLLAGDNFP